MGGIPKELDELLAQASSLQPGQQFLFDAGSNVRARKVQRWFAMQRRKQVTLNFTTKSELPEEKKPLYEVHESMAIKHQTHLTPDEADPWRGIITFICTRHGEALGYGSPSVGKHKQFLTHVCFQKPLPYKIGAITEIPAPAEDKSSEAQAQKSPEMRSRKKTKRRK